jgi:ADP-ribose pyrophosphatase YjhB (NUDIX family)
MPIPEYIRELRATVGHRLLWLPGVSAVVTNDAGELLLGQRSDNGQWSLISGFLDPGEQPAAAIVREVYEETAVSVVAERISSVITHPPASYPNGDLAQYVDITFRCRAVGGEARINDDESLAVGWFARDALPPLSALSHRRISRALDGPAAAWFVPSGDGLGC